MAILKPGFTRGARGRQTKASWGRRNVYLANEQDRESVILFGRDGDGVRELSRRESLEELGGKNAQYRETIVSYSEAECRALEERAGGDKLEAQRIAAQGMGGRLAGDKAYVVAVHEEQGRWHLHIAVKDEERPGLYGPRGEAQKLFDDFWRASRPRTHIIDWEAHRRSKSLQSDVKKASLHLQRVERERLEALRRASGAREKQAVSRDYDSQARALVAHRYHLDLEAIADSHQARGTSGGWEHRVDCERAEIRRIGQENRIQRREERLQARVEGRISAHVSSAHRTDKTLARGREAVIRSAQRTISVAERVASKTVDSALQQAGMPHEARQVARHAVRVSGATARALTRVASQVVRASTQMAKVAVPAVARQACHAAKITAQMSVGIALAIPTGGQSLTAAAKESGRDLGNAGKDLAKDGSKVLRTAGQEGARMAQETMRSATSFGLGALPQPVAQAARTGLEAGKTAAKTAAHLVSLDVLGAGSALAQGGAKTAGKALSVAAKGRPLPEPVRLASSVLEKIPIAGVALTVARKTVELAHGATHLARGLSQEVER